MNAVEIRPAKPGDEGRIFDLVAELAEFEKLRHLLVGSPEMLARDMFSESPKVMSIVAVLDGNIIGYALFFWTYSTFLTKPGLWMEDLYVTPEHRGNGIGQRLLNAVVDFAAQAGAGRLEWAVLDWNVNAIQFYEKLGADIMPDWRICRITDPGQPSSSSIK